MNKANVTSYLLVCLLSIITEIQQCSANRNNKGTKSYFQRQLIQNRSVHEVPQLNSTSGKFDWEGGSFPYDEATPEKDQTAFYYKAVLVAPIVGSILMISLVVAGVYALRQYDVPEFNCGKDADAICSNCSNSRTHGFRSKLHNYVTRLFTISKYEHEAYFIQIDAKSRTACSLHGHETLV